MNIEEWSAMMHPAVLYARPSSSQPLPVEFPSAGRHEVGEQAIDVPRWGHYQESDISDRLEKGGRYFPDTGNTYGPSQDHIDGAKKVRDGYEAFARTYAGSQMTKSMGLPTWDGFAMVDLGEGALAATITYTDGRKLLGWNSRYMNRIDAGLLAGPHLEEAVLSAVQRYGHPLGDSLVKLAADFYEAAFHEARHHKHGKSVFYRSHEAEEYATYTETAQFYRALAEQVKDQNYAMAKFYEAIADRSEYKARVHGKGGEDAHIEHIESLDGIAGMEGSRHGCGDSASQSGECSDSGGDSEGEGG